MTTLFKLKKATKSGECHAMRCVLIPYDRDARENILLLPTMRNEWGVGPGSDNVELCVKHVNIALTYAQRLADGAEIPPEQTAIVVSEQEAEGAKVVGWTERKAVGTWLSRVHEVVQEFESSQAEGAEVLAMAADYDVRTQADLVEVGAWTQDAKSRLKEISEKEKEITGPLATALSRIRDLCRPAKQVWVDAEAVLRAHLVAAKLREEENNRAAVAEAASAHAAGSDATGALSKMTTSTDLAGVSLRLKWKAVVENVMLLPEEYVVRIPNEKKLKEYCAAAVIEPQPIPGVRFEREVVSRVQTPKAIVL